MDFIIFLFLISLGFFVGGRVERKHYKDIAKREAELLDIPAVTSKELHNLDDVEEAQMVSANVVISLDYFKRFLAGLRNFFGGRIKAYETLLDRGRREAILRMKETAKLNGYDMIMNLRFETAGIGQVTSGRGSLGCFEVMVYGTAVKLRK